MAAKPRSTSCPAALACLAGLCVAVFLAGPAAAEHSSDVQQLTARGDYFGALVAYQKLPKRRITSSAAIAAGRSAWALSLPDLAMERFEEALGDDALSNEERARLTVSRGVIEFQEGRYQTAALYAEKAVTLLSEPGPLRGRAYQLWGEVLARLAMWGAAEEKYQQALAEALREDQPELHFALGLARLNLGKAPDARQEFEQVPLTHERAPEAIRFLAQIALDSGQYSTAGFWLKTGRERYPDSFIDSWVDYALVRAAAAAQNGEEVQRLLSSAEDRFPASDYWLTLAQGSAEAFQWTASTKKEAQ